MPKKRILTWLQATASHFHIGNYFGAVKPLFEMAEVNPDADVFLFLANMHSFTKLHDGDAIRNNSINTLKLYLAAGADPERFMIYNPADIPGHVQLGRVLTCLTHMWHMERMHAFKDKVQKWKANEASVGLFSYPILMAADILLYDATIIPVGKDQKQHVEYARDIAQKFNNQFGETFTLPEPYIKPWVWTIPGIDGRKMSKSYKNDIGILDDEKTVLKKVKQISTDAKAIEEPKNPDECNVYNIMRLLLTTEENQIMRQKYEAGWLSYKYAKDFLYEKLLAFSQPIQKRYQQISDQEIKDLLTKNAIKVSQMAEKKIEDVYQKVGFRL